MEKEWKEETCVFWPMPLKCDATAVRVKSLPLNWSLKCQRQSSRPPITSAHAGEARSRSVAHHSPSSLPPPAVTSSASFPSFLLLRVQTGAACVTQTMCLCPAWILEALFISFSRFVFMFSCGWEVCCEEQLGFNGTPSILFYCHCLSCTQRSCFPLVATWRNQSASSIKTILPMLIVTSDRFSNWQRDTELTVGI